MGVTWSREEKATTVVPHLPLALESLLHLAENHREWGNQTNPVHPKEEVGVVVVLVVNNKPKGWC